MDRWALSLLDNPYLVRVYLTTLRALDTTADFMMLPTGDNRGSTSVEYVERKVFAGGVLVITGSSLGTGYLLRNTNVGFVGGTLIIPALVGGTLVYRNVSGMSEQNPIFSSLGPSLRL